MLGARIEYSEARQPVIVTPFLMAGAMSPMGLAGTVAQQTAEALAGIALVQLIRPGTPSVYGSFLTNTDMQSGSPAFGTPESAMGILASAQMARHYNLPFRGGRALEAAAGGVCGSGYRPRRRRGAEGLHRTAKERARSLTDFLDELGSDKPVPDGGSAAAAAVAMAAGLVEKVARLSTPQMIGAAAIRKRAANVRVVAAACIESDAHAYLDYMAALQAARGRNAAERERILRPASGGIVSLPLKVARFAAEVADM